MKITSHSNPLWFLLSSTVLVTWSGLGAAGCDDPSASPGPRQTGTTILGATIYDGSGGPPTVADLRIEGDRIAAIGALEPPAGDVVVDADGLALAPGFIDTHSHADADLLDLPSARTAISQGITTVVGGADGGSPLPLADFFDRLEKTPVTINLAAFGGHNTYRAKVLGEDFRRAATAAEIEAMRLLLRADMEAGALGLSTGLEYDPGIYSSTDEVVSLASEAARFGGRYTSHLRSEDRAFWQAVEEILEIGRRAAIPVNITHIKLAMQSNIGSAAELIERLDSARAAGTEVTADIYPYTYWQSTLTVLFPDRDFDNLDSARFAVTEVSTPSGMMIARFDPSPELAGQTLAEIAAQRNEEPAVTLIDLIRESIDYSETSGEEDVESVIAVSMAEDDIARLLQWPYSNVCTDGELRGSHPRGAGSFTRVLGRYVRELGILSLPAAIHRMTERAALSVGLEDRGRIAPGAYADLVLFDPAIVDDRATTENPQLESIGITRVWVNGEQVWVGGRPTPARPGRVLRRIGS